MNMRNLPYVKAYVDGSFYQGRWGGGFAIYTPDNTLIYQDCGIGKDDPELNSMRNIAGEMSAAMAATQWIDYNVGKGIIIHDYIGLSKWVKSEWRTTKPFTKLYAEWMRPFYVLGIIDFEWVKGHTNVEGNEIADRLAKQSIILNQNWKS